MAEFNPGGAADLNQAVKLRYEANADTNAFTDAEKAKLTGVAAGATANASDVALRDRTTHTGEQAIATVTGLQAALDGKAATGHGHAIADVTGLQGALDGKAAASHGHAIADVTGLQAALDAKLETVTVGDISAAGTPSSSTYLRGDGSWATPAGGGGGGASNWGELGGNIADQADLQAALDGKAAASHGHDSATTSAAGFMSAADKTKLDGVAAGATANASDADLRDRATHTGTQPAASITGLAAVATSGSASDLGSGTLPIARVADGAVTNAKLANMAANTVKARANGSSGAPGDLAVGASQIVGRGSSGTVAALSVGNGLAVGASSLGMADMASGTIKGRATTGTGAPEDLSAAQVRTILNVADGATANATDAALRDRTTHTGEQAIATVTGLQAALDGKAATGHGHAIADVTGLQTALDGKAPTSHSHGVGDITASGTASASTFLRGDGAWATPAGGGGGIDWSTPVDAHVLPDADGTRNLGSASLRFGTVYADGLDIDGAPSLSGFTGLLGFSSGAAVDVTSKALLEARIGSVDLALATGDEYTGTHDFDDATLVLPGGATVSGSDGLSDPNANRIVFWNDSANALAWLTVGSGLSISGTTLTATGGGGGGGIDWSTPVDADILPDEDGVWRLGSELLRFEAVHTDLIDLNGVTISGADNLAAPGANRLVGWDHANTQLAWQQLSADLALLANVLGLTDRGRRRFDGTFYARNEFQSIQATDAWLISQTGTSAATTASATIYGDDGVGWVQSVTGTTASGRTGFFGPQADLLRLDRFDCRWRHRVRFNTLSTGTERYTFRSGLIDSQSAEATDGAFFRYVENVNGGRFEAVCRSNGSESGSVVDTGITVAASTIYLLEIDATNAATDGVRFYIDGTLVATITTNVPQGSGRDTGYGFFVIKSVGTTSITAIQSDYAEFEAIPRGAR